MTDRNTAQWRSDPGENPRASRQNERAALTATPHTQTRPGHQPASARDLQWTREDSRSVATSTATRPTATVLRSPSTNHPRIHRVHRATFDATGVLAPACASADSRRDTVFAARSRQPRYRDTAAAVTCEKPRCSEDNAGTAPPDDATDFPVAAEPACR
jgi:hypothetical protein